jgi:hypothetical protein
MGITKDNPMGSGWERIDGGLVDIAVGPNGEVWGVNHDTRPEADPHGGLIFCRVGITASTPNGEKWIATDGAAKQVAIGPDGQVFVVSNDNSAWYREGITKDKPEGTKWTRLDGRLNQIAIGPDGQLWGLFADADSNGNYDVLFRKGITKEKPYGTTWDNIDKGFVSRLARISVGPMGDVWGITGDRIWFRDGITEKNPEGTCWTEIDGALVRIAVGPMPAVDTAVVAQVNKVEKEENEVKHLPRGFVKVPGIVKKIAVGSHTVTIDGKKEEQLDRWAIGTNGKLLNSFGKSDEWTAHVAKDDKGVEISGFIDVSIGGDGTVYAIAADGKVYRYNRKGESMSAAPSEVKEETKKEEKVKKAEVRAAKKAKKLGRATAKKETKKVAKKKVTKKKAAAKKATKKTPVTKKVTAKKPTSKKVTTKKTTTKKVSPKKTVAKKTTTEKTIEKKADVVKTTDEKKEEEKKSVEKTVEKPVEKTAEKTTKESPFAGAPAR